MLELLIVITIIAVLAGLTIPVAGILLEKAKQNKARSMAHTIVIAIENYAAEYNRLPNPNNLTADATLESTEADGLLKILMGEDTTKNPRGGRYLTPALAKNNLDGLTMAGDIVDPWGQVYHITLDFDGDHKISNPVKAQDGKFSPGYLVGERDDLPFDVGVYSDGNPTTKTSARKAITSW